MCVLTWELKNNDRKKSILCSTMKKNHIKATRQCCDLNKTRSDLVKMEFSGKRKNAGDEKKGQHYKKAVHS